MRTRTFTLCMAAATLAPLSLLAQNANAPAVPSANSAVDQHGPTIKDAYKGQFLIGAAGDLPDGYSEKELNLAKENFGILTPENCFKPASIHPAEDKWTFDRADSLLKWCGENNIAVHGHTLLWHAQTNPWFFQGGDKQVIIKRMQDHIATLVGRYKGKIYSWDVVNEAINDANNAQTENLRPSQWMQTVGPEFLTIAFNAAHEADPNAKLYYNDYNIENGPKHESSMLLLKRLLKDGAPIYGVGIQGHWSTTSLPYDALDKAISDYASLGLKVAITELDITVGGTSGGQLNQTGPTGQAGPGAGPGFGGGFGFFSRTGRAATLNPADSARAVVTDLSNEQKAKLAAASENFITQMIQWQVSSQEAIQAAQPKAGQGRFPQPADIAKYNAVQYQQTLAREDMIIDAELAVAAILTPAQAETWETARLKAQVSTRLGTMGVTEAQTTKTDAVVASHATKLAEAKDKAALFAAKAAFWKEIVGALDDSQATILLAPPTDLSRSRIPGLLPPQALKAQADAYARVFAILEKHKEAIDRVTFWGVNDRRSWRMGENPLLFDVNNQRKPAYQAIVDVVAHPAK